MQILSNTATDYNNRYEVKLNKDKGGTGDPQQKTSNNNSTSMMLTFNTRIAKKTDLKPEIFNTKEYKFGPFDKIYKPDFSTSPYTENIVLSTEFDETIQKITTGSPMLFSFIGTTGSKKTKVLKND